MEDLETFSGVLGLDQGLASILKSLNWTTTRLATLVDAESLIGQRLSREALVDMIHAAHTWAEMAWKVEGSANGSELLAQSAISRAQRKMNEMREVRRRDILAAVPRKGTAARAKWPTRLERIKADAGCDIDLREKAEKKERDRWVASLTEEHLGRCQGTSDILHGWLIGRYDNYRFGKGQTCWDSPQACQDMASVSSLA